VTELCTGGELFDKITAGVFTENLAAKYMHQLMTAVCYLHNHQVVHRDLKPENLILESSSHEAVLKLIDFGNSLVFRKARRMTTFVGTVSPSQSYYLAPEVIAGRYNEKCDIWSCGVILFLMLSGSVPFNGKNDDQIIENIKKGTFTMKSKSWTTVSKEAKNLVLRMMRKDSENRPTASEVLSDPWILQRLQNQLPDNPISKKCLFNLAKFRVICT
jgi:calcium-dependent protein kinase